MKVVAIQSSPNRDGLTSRLAQAALSAVAAAGIETELIHLHAHRINPCQACGNGWGQCWNVPNCIQTSDEFQALREKLNAADAIIFSSPVYFWDLSESARIFLDRLRRVEWPRREAALLRGKLALGICAAGGSGTGAPSAVRYLEDYFNRLQLKPVAYLAVSRQNAELQLKASEEAGRFLADQLLAAK